MTPVCARISLLHLAQGNKATHAVRKTIFPVTVVTNKIRLVFDGEQSATVTDAVAHMALVHEPAVFVVERDSGEASESIVLKIAAVRRLVVPSELTDAVERVGLVFVWRVRRQGSSAEGNKHFRPFRHGRRDRWVFASLQAHPRCGPCRNG